MKINIPTKKNDSIDLSEINEKSNGIIICYFRNKPNGYIIYDDLSTSWFYFNSIDTSHCTYSNENLLTLINNLIKDSYSDNFDYISFEDSYVDNFNHVSFD